MSERSDLDEAHVEAVQARAARAKERELEAHARAAVLHDEAAATQDRLGHPELAERAHDRAAQSRADAVTASDERSDSEERIRRRTDDADDVEQPPSP